jgi:hypothetical protein
MKFLLKFWHKTYKTFKLKQNKYSLDLKSRPKQLLGYLLLDFASQVVG